MIDSVVDSLYDLANKIWMRSVASGRWAPVSMEDAVQQAVVHCWTVRASYDSARSEPNAFYWSVMENEMQRLVFKARRKYQQAQLPMVDHFDAPASDAYSPVQTAIRHEEEARIAAMTAGMDPSLRFAVVGRLDGVRWEDVAGHLSRQGVQKAVRKAVRAGLQLETYRLTPFTRRDLLLSP